ncbi:MAG: tRNA-dihydrouridine synthase, partial [Myxococcota bacterium]|nr:tRNA-dihydrouridine synthase [Myxococcota bacterium]
MATPDVVALAGRFADAARRAVAAGFDAVEIHAAHGFLLSCFLSPLTNRRDDAYGGDADRRALLHVEIVRAVGAAVGGRVALLVRLGVDDLAPGGIGVEEGAAVAAKLVAAGADAIDVSGGLCGSRPAELSGQGFFVPQAEAVRRVAGVPVIGVGGVTDAEAARRFVADGRVDAIAVGRRLAAHPEWAREALGRA